MTTTCAPWRRGWAAFALAAALAVAGPVSTAAAHDELTGTEPTDGTTVEVAPEQVRMDFSGDIASVGSFVTVTGPLGTVTDGAPQVEGTAVSQPLVADAPPGGYAVVWRVTSRDGHPISGEFDYTVPSGGVEAQGDQAPDESASPRDEAAGTSAPLADDAASSTTQASAAEPDSSTDASDRAANTAAAPARGDSSASSGTAIWVWGVVALALVTLGGLGAVALRRR